MELRIWILMGVSSLGWGTSGVGARAALGAGIPPVGMAAIRSLLAAVVIYSILAAIGRPLARDRSSLRLGLVMAVTNLALPFILITIALQYASAGFVGLLIALVPLMTAFLAHFLLHDEPMTTGKFVALTVAFAGVVVLLASGSSGLEAGGRPLLASVLSFAGALSIAFAGVYAKGQRQGYDPIQLTGLQFAFGSLFVVLAMLAMEGIPEGITTWGWMLLIYLTLIGSVMPFFAFYWVLNHTSSTRASTIGYIVPLIALMAGIVFIDERLQIGIAIGGTLILAGVIAANRAERRLVRV